MARLFRRILVPVDFSIFSARATVIANDLARRFRSELTLVHVIEASPTKVAPTFNLVRRVAGRLRLSQFAAAVQPAMTEAQQIISVGKPANEIAALADSSRADLILIATNGHGESARERFMELLESDVAVMMSGGHPELRHIVLGSTTERIVRHAPCPVLVVRGHDRMAARTREASMAIQKIILATDLSVNSLKAFPLAQALAQEFAASVALSYALPSLELYFSGGEINRLRKKGAGQLARVRYEYLSADLPVEMCLLDGAPERALCQAARLGNCDLIVLSTHGHTTLRHAFLGGTTERVVRHAPCSVLVVR